MFSWRLLTFRSDGVEFGPLLQGVRAPSVVAMSTRKRVVFDFFRIVYLLPPEFSGFNAEGLSSSRSRRRARWGVVFCNALGNRLSIVWG